MDEEILKAFELDDEAGTKEETPINTGSEETIGNV